MLDNNISFRFAAMLRALDVDIVALRNEMPSNTADVDFLGNLRTRYEIDVFVSGNTKQRTNPIERQLLKASGVTSLYFNPFFEKMGFWRQAAWLVNRWPTIDGFAKGVSLGTCADVQQNGRATIFPL
jgi:hypothetical protein